MTVKRKKAWVWDCKCQRCGRAWKATTERPPERCPECKARNWEKKARVYTRKAADSK